MLRAATRNDLAAVAELIAGQQADPARNIPYLGEEVGGVTSELAELEHPWTDHAIVDEDGSGLTGFMAGEIDRDMGRVWWLGPFLAGPWIDRVDALYHQARSSLPPEIHQEELAGDHRHTDLAAFAERRGFAAEEASALLNLEQDLGREPSPAVVPLADRHHEAVAALHGEAFPHTHLSPRQVLITTDRKIRMVVEHDGEAAGYVAADLQSDGGGYIDFLAVHRDHRRRGMGADLVAAASRALLDMGASRVHLTVRETNVAARALYTSIGFTEERLLRPYRRGFSLA